MNPNASFSKFIHNQDLDGLLLWARQARDIDQLLLQRR